MPEITPEQSAVIEAALNDAYAYRTDSGQTLPEELDEFARDLIARYQSLADYMGLVIES